MVRTEIERYLDTYSLEEILNENDLTEEEVLTVLIDQEMVHLPNPRPADID
jgi:hypothetical protein